MTALLWLDVAALGVASVVAVLDVDVRLGGRAVGRAVYGALVLAGLVGCYLFVVGQGWLPVPGWVLLGFAVLYLPFLSSAFIDLSVTDARARNELESLLLSRDFAQLRHGSGQDVVREGRRRLRLHWESHDEEGGILVELDVHPSLLPVTISRPHVAWVRDQLHLERIRGEIRSERRRRGDEEPA
jgi:hypothetical protein